MEIDKKTDEAEVPIEGSNAPTIEHNTEEQILSRKLTHSFPMHYKIDTEKFKIPQNYMDPLKIQCLHYSS